MCADQSTFRSKGQSMNEPLSDASLTADIMRYLRYQLRGRRALITSGLGVGVVSLWFGWPWLMAAGLAPILVAMAPCAIMCAVGFCTMKACSAGTHGGEGSVAPLQIGDSIVAVPSAAEPLKGASEQIQAHGSAAEDAGDARSESADSTGAFFEQGRESA